MLCVAVSFFSLLSKGTTVCLSNHLLVNSWVVSSLGLLQIKLP